MASQERGANTLSETQQDALRTYVAVTNQERSQAIPLLQRSEWNVQIAIAKFFDGEAPDPLVEARASLASSSAPSQIGHRETLLNGSASFPRSADVPGGDPAPRVVPQSVNQTNLTPFTIIAILLAPVGSLYQAVARSLNLLGYLFPFLPRLLSSFSSSNPSVRSRQNTSGRRPLNPRDTAARFAREFEEEYGSHSLKFFENGYAQAYDQAKKDLKYLLVILISPEHDDTSSFVRETLLSNEVVNYIKDPQNNIILWAGSVQDSEAYQISAALNCSKFPFTALITYNPQSPSTMSTVARITGLLPPSTYLLRLQTAISQQSTALATARAAQAEQRATQSLRVEQNSAYERSLAQDRERARQRREVEASRSRIEQEARERAEAAERDRVNLEKWKQWRARSIPPEPSPDAENVTRVSIRMTSGERIIRRFAPATDMENLYALVECYNTLQSANSLPSEVPSKPDNYSHEYRFRLVSPIPRIVHSLDVGGTVGERIGRSGNLIVEPIGDDEDVEDE